MPTRRRRIYTEEKQAEICKLREVRRSKNKLESQRENYARQRDDEFFDEYKKLCIKYRRIIVDVHCPANNIQSFDSIELVKYKIDGLELKCRFRKSKHDKIYISSNIPHGLGIGHG